VVTCLRSMCLSLARTASQTLYRGISDHALVNKGKANLNGKFYFIVFKSTMPL
jgi:hypothetical protein